MQAGRGAGGVDVELVVVELPCATAIAGRAIATINPTPKSKARNFIPLEVQLGIAKLAETVGFLPLTGFMSKIISLLFAHKLQLLYSVRVLAPCVGTEVVKRDAL